MRSLVPLALLILALAPPAAAQDTILYDFDLLVPEGLQNIEVNQGQDFVITFRDKSRDGTSIVPGAPPNSVFFHQVDFTVTTLQEDDAYWFLSQPGGFQIKGGETQNTSFNVRVDTPASNPYLRVNVNATITILSTNQRFYREATIQFHTMGVAGYHTVPGSAIQGLKPRESAQAVFTLVNDAPVPRSFDFEMARNDCELEVVPPATVALFGKESRDVSFTVRGPETRFSLMSANYCLVGIDIVAQDNGLRYSESVLVQLAPAVAIDPMTIAGAVAALLLLILIALFVRRRKERLEEEILGKPQKPWNIPVERLYLSRLKRKDPRAWYVVRHYLMEEEYRSSLLWYKAYKAATKGDRKKERLILKQERDYESWRAKWERRIAKPMAQADAFEAKLQRKLERRAKRRNRAARKKWRKLTKGLKAAHGKAQRRADEAHAKAAAKAAKKGRPEPAKPKVPAPETPPEPQPVVLQLSEHRWARRAARFRKRMVQKQGSLEVRFEKADAAYLARLRRTVQRIGRKLDDPTFVAEHPMLQA